MDGFSIGGKTATSEKLPRGNGKYISSFLGFAKADNPAIIGIVLIDEPHGTYYGGTIAAPVMRSVFQTALPYMGIYKEYTPDKKEPLTKQEQMRWRHELWDCKTSFNCLFYQRTS